MIIVLHNFTDYCCIWLIRILIYFLFYSHNILPIAMGAHPSDYRRDAPEKSFIHVDDFDSPRELADYLHLLDQNDDLYNEYFR